MTLKSRFLHSHCLLLPVLFALAMCSEAMEPDTFHYSVISDDVVSGKKTVSIQRRSGSGSTIFIIDVESVNKQIVDTRQIIKMHSRYEVDSVSGSLNSLNNTIQFGGRTLDADFLIQGDTVTLVSEGRQIAAIAIPPDGVFDNTIYYPYLISAFQQSDSNSITRQVFIPQSQGFDPVQYARLGKEVFSTFEGQKEVYHVQELNLRTGTQKTKWIDTKTGVVIRTDWNYHTEILSAPVQERDLQYADLTRNYFFPVDVTSTSNQAFHSLVVNISARTSTGLADRANLSGINQTFQGEVKDQRISGTFEVSSIRYADLPNSLYPIELGTEADDLQPYLSAEPFIDPNHPAFLNLARDLTEGAVTLRQAVDGIGRFVHKRIVREDRTVLGAQTVYETQTGDCAGQSQLFVALLRAAHIPARLAMGAAIASNLGGSLGQHVWVEYFDPQVGWIPYDVTLNQFERFSAGHVKLAANSNCLLKSAHISDYSLWDE